MKVIGIDLGTTTISAAVLDPETKQQIRTVTVPNKSFIKTENPWEKIQDPAVIVQQAKHVLDEFLQEYPDTASIGISCQMHGIVYTDQDGKAVSPLYTWQDQRGAEVTEEILQICGIKVPAGYGLATHLYNVEHHLVPEAAEKICTIGDYLGMCLCGRSTPLIHSSNACSLGFYDAEHACFRTDLLSKMDVSADILPEVTESFEEIGAYQDIPVTAAIGDNQASFLGAAGLKENTVLLNMGTGGQISVLSDTFFACEDIEARPLVKGKYLLVGASLCGGRAYAILEQFLRSYTAASTGKEVSQYEVMEQMAVKGAGENPMIVDTRFAGTRKDPSLRGSIRNISEDNFTPEGLIYGILCGMSQELYDMYRKIAEGTGVPVEHLIASGNGYRRNKVLQEISARMFNVPLSLSPYTEEAACGAALCSLYSGRNV